MSSTSASSSSAATNICCSLYLAAKSGDQNFFRALTPFNSNVLCQLTRNGNTILHIAVKFERMEIAAMIINLQPALLHRKNSKGDTALHIAARLGNSRIVQVLINYEMENQSQFSAPVEKLARMVNKAKDTALHEAARNGSFDASKLLINIDPELVMFKNEAEESPLFIAVDKTHLKIANHILEVAQVPCHDNGTSWIRGRNNMNALHAAIIRTYSYGKKLICPTSDIPWIISYLVESQSPTTVYSYDYIAYIVARIYPLLSSKDKKLKTNFITRLVEKCPSAISEADKLGWTPLHCAANLGEQSIVRILLSARNCVAYIQDKEGMTALHIAAKEGHVSVLQELAKTCLDIWDLQDNKERTALHVAVEGNKTAVVKFILQEASQDIINQQDNEGNTPLHLAGFLGHVKIFKLMVNDKRVDKTVVNKEGLPVMDIIQSKLEMNFLRRVYMSAYLFDNGGLATMERVLNRETAEHETSNTEANNLQQVVQQTGSKTPVKQNLINEDKQHTSENENLQPNNRLEKIVSTNTLVSTLIATVSFAAAITMPGGCNNVGPEEGTAILSKKAAVVVFVIANTLAFCLSTLSTYYGFLTSMQKKGETIKLLYFARWVTQTSITAMILAFASGSYAVLANFPGLAIGVLTIGCCLLYCL